MATPTDEREYFKDYYYWMCGGGNKLLARSKFASHYVIDGCFLHAWTYPF
jgi:hypothetical protein